MIIYMFVEVPFPICPYTADRHPSCSHVFGVHYYNSACDEIGELSLHMQALILSIGSDQTWPEFLARTS